jgi:hypothetical protein
MRSTSLGLIMPWSVVLELRPRLLAQSRVRSTVVVGMPPSPSPARIQQCAPGQANVLVRSSAYSGFLVKPGFSKERRLEPQITIGLLTDASGFPLMVEAFEGNAAETTTMLPTIRAFIAAHQLADVTIVADAGRVSDGTVVRAGNGADGDPAL